MSRIVIARTVSHPRDVIVILQMTLTRIDSLESTLVTLLESGMIEGKEEGDTDPSIDALLDTSPLDISAPAAPSVEQVDMRAGPSEPQTIVPNLDIGD